MLLLAFIVAVAAFVAALAWAAWEVRRAPLLDDDPDPPRERHLRVVQERQVAAGQRPRSGNVLVLGSHVVPFPPDGPDAA